MNLGILELVICVRDFDGVCRFMTELLKKKRVYNEEYLFPWVKKALVIGQRFLNQPRQTPLTKQLLKLAPNVVKWCFSKIAVEVFLLVVVDIPTVTSQNHLVLDQY